METAWVPVTGENYLYIYCLWAAAPYKGKGYGRALMEYCIADAREKGKCGVCMLGAQKQKACICGRWEACLFVRSERFWTGRKTGPE